MRGPVISKRALFTSLNKLVICWPAYEAAMTAVQDSL